MEKIGRYEIVSELGRGAMGLVYRAVDPNIGRTVALKTMRLDVQGMERDQLLRRFKSEARAAGVMNHPNIVIVYDADEIDGLFYIAMEYLEGQTLQSMMMEKRVVPGDDIVQIGKQVAAGLDYAHKMQVIHRDVKPANIMITPQGVAKIMDFGISKVAGSMTNTSQVLGTPNYMSPEQVKGLQLDGRADLFSFGVVLYEMATGERPFSGDNVTTIIYKIINERPIDPSELEIALHPGLSAVISKCLEKNPVDRYQSGAALAADLENYRSIGDEGCDTAVLPAPSEFNRVMVESTQAFGRATAAFAAAPATQAVAHRTAAVPAASRAPSATQTANASASVPVPSRKATAIVALCVLCVLAAAAAMYGVKHRKQGLQSNPAATQQTQVANPPATQPTPAPETNPAPPASAPSASARLSSAQSTAAPAKKPAEHATEAAHTAGKVEVRFTSNPAGAFVQIDGKSSSEWVTPFTMPDLTPGSHEIAFTKLGYSTETRTLEIGPKNSSYNLDLVPGTTALWISSTPQGASIEVDGRDTGKVTPAQIPVAEGDHKVVVRLDGYRTQQMLASVEKGKVFSFTPMLNPGDARQAGNSNPVTNRLGKIFGGGMRGGKGMINFVSTPPGATIFIQGQKMAFATPAHVPIPEGDYRIVFRESGYKPVEQNVHVEAGKNVKVVVTLDPQ